jgi:hypothetical protein
LLIVVDDVSVVWCSDTKYSAISINKLKAAVQKSNDDCRLMQASVEGMKMQWCECEHWDFIVAC